jgi:hypothetical protein
MLKLPGIINLNEWNQHVMQFGYGDTTTPALNERRVQLQNGTYNLCWYNGAAWVWFNNAFYNLTNPFIWADPDRAIGSSGTMVTYPVALATAPVVVGVPKGAANFIRIDNITSTSCKVYLYNTSGTGVSGWAHIIVVGCRNV